MCHLFCAGGGVIFPLKAPVSLQHCCLSNSIPFVQDPKNQHKKMRHVNSNKGYKTPALIIPLTKGIKYILKASGALQPLKAV